MGSERAPVFGNFGQGGQLNDYKTSKIDNEVVKSWPEHRRSDGVFHNENIIPKFSKKDNEDGLTQDWIEST